MASAIDSSFIGAGNVSKSGMITALNTARDEITALQTSTTLPTNISFGVPAMFGLVVNPYMEISQQYGVASTTIGSGIYPVDQMQALETCATLTATSGQVNDPNTGIGILARLRNGVKTTTTTAQAVLAVAEVFIPFQQPIDGTTIRHLMWGTSSARGIVIIACVSASVTGTYAVAVRNGAANRSYIATVSLVAATPTMIYVAVPGDQTGTWASDTSLAMIVSIGAVGGTNWQAGTLNVWGASNSVTHASATNWGATLSSTLTVSYFNIIPENTLPVSSAAELVGSTLNTLFDIRRPYEEELRRSQGYWQPLIWSMTEQAAGAQSTTMQYTFLTTMRITPAVTDTVASGSTGNVATIITDTPSVQGCRLGMVSIAAGQYFALNRLGVANARL